MKFKMFIENFASLTKTKIIFLAKTNLTNEEKKERLDAHITSYIENGMNSLPLNFIEKFIIKKFLIANIPAITQVIFNLLKDKIDGNI